MKIEVMKNGPYIIKSHGLGVYKEGEIVDLKDGPIALCRCGMSLTKPFCDGSHKMHMFEGDGEIVLKFSEDDRREVVEVTND